jgi:hypothetical protein
MSSIDLFEVIFAITAIILLVLGITAIIAPSFSVTMPTTPTFPSFASNLDWTVSLTDWSGIGSFFIFIGGLIVYFCAFLVFMISSLSAFFIVLGLLPNVAAVITVLIVITFGGSLLMFIRGSGDGSK